MSESMSPSQYKKGELQITTYPRKGGPLHHKDNDLMLNSAEEISSAERIESDTVDQVDTLGPQVRGRHRRIFASEGSKKKERKRPFLATVRDGIMDTAWRQWIYFASVWVLDGLEIWEQIFILTVMGCFCALLTLVYLKLASLFDTLHFGPLNLDVLSSEPPFPL
ncbi:hypothetical protein IE53DRAFT_393550 [Violaceomyces palustris]|uniref:Uncharacterized protein n=1 Tax=Violaceomyces palustris TaxID=1673888 RepID=A0ACD0NZU3_9BASI|nr:hypothetical protein IE53DRAFT_393550 [Violaceomyces palustris]